MQQSSKEATVALEAGTAVDTAAGSADMGTPGSSTEVGRAKGGALDEPGTAPATADTDAAKAVPVDAEVEARVPKAVPVDAEVEARVPPDFDCRQNAATWVKDWSIYKKAWCCSSVGRGCPEDVDVEASPYDCEAGLAGWQQSWHKAKKAWCCSHEGLGCQSAEALPTATQPSPCEATCSRAGLSATCRSRVQWAAAHEFPGDADACALALNVVVHQCDACQACTLHGAECVAQSMPNALHDCISDFPDGPWDTTWTTHRKAWCCQHTARGCMVMTMVPFECTFDFVHRLTAWSAEKQDWCCKNERVCD